MATVRATIVATQPTGLVVNLHGWGGGGTGYVPSITATAESFQPMGGTGTGRQQMGFAGRQVRIPVSAWATSEEEAITIIEMLELMVSYTVTISTSYQVFRATIDAAELRPRRVKGPPISAGVLATWRVEGELLLERQPDA